MQGVGKQPLIVAAAAVVLTLGYAGLGAAAAGDLTQPSEPSTLNTDTGFEQGLIDAMTEASEEDEPIDRALDAAQAGLQHHLDHGEIGSEAATLSLEAQMTNVENARAALEIIQDEELEPFEESIRLAQLGILWQAENLGVEASDEFDAPTHAQPSQALETLLERHGETLDGANQEAALALDGIDEDAREALTDLLDAFIAVETAVTELSQALPESSVSTSEQAEILDLVERVEAGEITSHEDLMDVVDVPASTERAQAPSELGDVLVQRILVLDASLDLYEALQDTNENHVFDEPGVIRIDLSGEDSFYEDDYAYIVEAGGANVYHNNAGGSNVGGGSCFAPVEEPTSAALIDLGTQDKEFGNPADEYFCGSNGGGFAGFDHGNVGVGTLVTAGGDNVYSSSTAGGNGGGHGQAAGVGVGLVVDGDGSNTLGNGALGANGGGSNGYFEEIGIGVGLLVLGGDGADTLEACCYGSNGGAVEWGFGNAHGGVISAGGDDVIDRDGGTPSFGSTGGLYVRSTSVAHAFIVNGGGSNAYDGTVGATGGAHSGADSHGAAFVLDADGGSTFTGNHQAVNGGVRGGTGAGLLVSGPGDDRFETNRGSGVNGAANSASEGRALLVDAGGNDHYESGWGTATNGGVWGSGFGTLFDVEGDDTYLSFDDRGVNGGAAGSSCAVTLVFVCVPNSVGLLLDGSGSDTYEDEAGGTGEDHTVFPKGTLGGQIDLPNLP